MVTANNLQGRGMRRQRRHRHTRIPVTGDSTYSRQHRGAQDSCKPGVQTWPVASPLLWRLYPNSTGCPLSPHKLDGAPQKWSWQTSRSIPLLREWSGEAKTDQRQAQVAGTPGKRGHPLGVASWYHRDLSCCLTWTQRGVKARGESQHCIQAPEAIP